MEVPRGFTRCDECEGRGKASSFEARPLDPTGFSWSMTYDPCPPCSGSGLVPTEKLREEAKRAVLAVNATSSTKWGHAFIEQADAVLATVAVHLTRENN